MSPIPRESGDEPLSFPRTRGDEPTTHITVNGALEFSPHARG